MVLSLFEARDEVEHHRNLVDAHAGGRLVEHEDVGLERHHHRHFELALIAVRQRGGALRRAAARGRRAASAASARVDQIAAQRATGG